MTDINDYQDVVQTAARWGVSRQRVYVWITEGRVPTVDAFGKTLIPRSARKPRARKSTPGPRKAEG